MKMSVNLRSWRHREREHAYCLADSTLCNRRGHVLYFHRRAKYKLSLIPRAMKFPNQTRCHEQSDSRLNIKQIFKLKVASSSSGARALVCGEQFLFDDDVIMK